MSGLDAEIESIKELFKSKIKDIADKITKDANTISGIADRMRGIVTKSGNASRKIIELKELIEQVDSDEHLSTARERYDGEIANLTSALDGKAPNLDHDLDQETQASTGIFSGMFSSKKPTGFMKQLTDFAKQLLTEKKIKLSSKELNYLITDKPSTALTRNYINMNTRTSIDHNIMDSIRRDIVHYMNTNKTDKSKPDVQLGGFLSNSRKLKRPSRKNTRDFFKFTRKSSEKPQGAKKLRKSRRKRRKQIK